MSITLIVLSAYAVVLLLIGFWASRRNSDNTDYLLGGRRLGPWIAALSASASSSSAWTLLGVSGAAYVWGLSSLWLFPATLGGFLINWFLIAPRLRVLSAETGALTLTELIAPPAMGGGRAAVVRVAAIIILVSFIFYIASQFEAAAKAFEVYFQWPREYGVVTGVSVVLLYTLLGGFWAASVSDAVQGLMMVIAALVLPVAGLVAVGGFGGLAHELSAVMTPAQLSWSGPFGATAGVFFVLGTLGIGLGYPGQPHVVNRFMALRNERSLRQARAIAIVWAVIIYSGMLTVGLCARALFGDIADGEQVLFQFAERVLPAAASAMLLAAVLSAIMSTADSQLLVAASALSHDWYLASREQASRLATSRWLVFLLCVAAALLALYLPDDIFSRVLFAWHALGSAFGPLLVLRLSGIGVGARATLLTLATGFGLTVLINGFANQPGDWVERLVPLLAAFAVAWFGRVRRVVG